MKNETVSIRFKQQAYRLLKNHAFRPAYVFAEFIDNSIQSFEDNKSVLMLSDRGYRLKIRISWENGSIVIEDNAAGILDEKMESAFEPGHVPENNKGLNEFGIGMKNAAVWMSDFYIVETSGIGESYVKTIKFDYHEVITNEIEDLVISYVPQDVPSNFTRIILQDLREEVAKFNFDLIAKELGSIYRGMISDSQIEIEFMGKQLSYKYPDVLTTPFYPDLVKFKKGDGKVPPLVKWRYDFDINYQGKRMFGFVGILSKMQKHENGISYCRRGRVIQGSGDEKVFPTAICGKDASSHQRKRIFGEFNFDGFEVSFDKGKLLAEEDAESLIELLADQLKFFKPSNSDKVYDFLKQAKDLRVDDDIKEKEIIEKLQKKHKTQSKKSENDEVRREEETKYQRIFNKKVTTPSKEGNNDQEIPEEKRIEKTITGVGGESYLVRYTIKSDIAQDVLYEMQIRDVRDRGEKELLKQGISKIIEGFINVGCPFLTKYDQLLKGRSADGFYEMVEYLMIAEAIAQIKGFPKAQYIRDTLNELLNT
jgi:hypothetical protein